MKDAVFMEFSSFKLQKLLTLSSIPPPKKKKKKKTQKKTKQNKIKKTKQNKTKKNQKPTKTCTYINKFSPQGKSMNH